MSETKYADYYECAVPTRYRVLGLRLKPFCLGHRLNLIRLQSPFVFGEQSIATNRDLLLALMICACSFEEGQEFLSSPSAIKREIRRWDKMVGRRWWIFARKVDWAEAKRLFLEILREASLQPKVWRRTETAEGSLVEVGAPEELALRVSLLGKMTQSEIMNAYLPSVWFDYYALREREEGRKIFYTHQDQLDQMEAEMTDG